MTDIIAALIISNASLHHVDPLLVSAIIKVESNYRLDAVGSVGERGLMQVRPEYFSIPAKLLDDPAINLAFGIRHLRYKMNACKHLGRASFVCYNRGAGAGKRLSQQQAEKTEYYQKVMTEYKRLQWNAIKLGTLSLFQMPLGTNVDGALSRKLVQINTKSKSGTVVQKSGQQKRRSLTTKEWTNLLMNQTIH